MPTNKYALDCAAFDAPDQIGREADTLLVDLMYPTLPDWQEVAFAQAWARDPREHPPAPTSPAPDVHASCRRSFERALGERNAMIDASEEKRLVALADELDEDNRATDARLLRAALAELGRYRTAGK